MKFYSDSIDYHCNIHQSKPGMPWLMMLHGFMGSGEIFTPLLEKLTAFCNPITIDLAGHGKTETPNNPSLFTAERQASHIASVARRFQIKNLHLYGYSMGGRLVFQIIARYPGIFKSGIIESAHCGMEPGTEQQKRQSLDKQRALELETDFEAFLKGWQTIPLFRHTPKKMKARYATFMASQNPALMAASLRGFGSGAMSPVCHKLSKIMIPVQLIAGERDTNYVNLMEQIAALNPRFSFDVVENAGHRVHANRPEQWAEVIRRALGGYLQ